MRTSEVGQSGLVYIIMPDNKLVIRRLPPCLSEQELLEQLSPLPDHDYFCFFEANPGLGPHSFSRAYINFIRPEDMKAFLVKFDSRTFTDRDGHEYVAVVEEAMWHKSPNCGPFYRGPQDDLISPTSTNTVARGAIQEDPDFMRFMDDLQSHKKRPAQQSPVQTLRSSPDESSLLNSGSSNKNNSKVVTPLISYLNQQRSKGSKRSR